MVLKGEHFNALFTKQITNEACIQEIRLFLKKQGLLKCLKIHSGS